MPCGRSSLLLIVGLLLVSVGRAFAAEPAVPAPAASKWEKAIAEFEAQDEQSPPAAGGVLFVGSSSIRLWDLKQSFPEVAAINRGFGGSQMSDVVHYAGRIVTPYKPRAIVLYEGDNDLAANKTPEKVAADFSELLKKIRAELPEAKVVVIGCKPSPARWKLIAKQREANRLLAAACKADEHATFLDVEKPMLSADGVPRAELFREDKLHLNAEGYKLWTSLVQPLIGERSSN